MALTTLTVRVDQEELDFLDRLALQHEGILSKQGVVRLLLQHAQAAGWDPLDRSVTLGVQSAAGTPSTSISSSIPKSINSKNKKEGRKRQEYP